MIAALPVHEISDAVSSFIAAPGAFILMLAATAIVALLILETAYVCRTFQALSRLT